MKTLRVVNETRGVTLGRRVGLAEGFWTRLRGLLFRPPLVKGEGLLLVPCQGVHTFGMKYAIDVALLAEDGEVLGLHPEVGPGGYTGMNRSARAVLELPEGTLAASGTRVGDRISWTPEPPGARSSTGGRARS